MTQRLKHWAMMHIIYVCALEAGRALYDYNTMGQREFEIQ